MASKPLASRNRSFGLPGTGAGKGDTDRSPGWRDHYDEIDFRRGPVGAPDLCLDDGFRRVSASRIRKVYK